MVTPSLSEVYPLIHAAAQRREWWVVRDLHRPVQDHAAVAVLLSAYFARCMLEQTATYDLPHHLAQRSGILAKAGLPLPAAFHACIRLARLLGRHPELFDQPAWLHADAAHPIDRAALVDELETLQDPEPDGRMGLLLMTAERPVLAWGAALDDWGGCAARNPKSPVSVPALFRWPSFAGPVESLRLSVCLPQEAELDHWLPRRGNGVLQWLRLIGPRSSNAAAERTGGRDERHIALIQGCDAILARPVAQDLLLERAEIWTREPGWSESLRALPEGGGAGYRTAVHLLRLGESCPSNLTAPHRRPRL